MLRHGAKIKLVKKRHNDDDLSRKMRNFAAKIETND